MKSNKFMKITAAVMTAAMLASAVPAAATAAPGTYDILPVPAPEIIETVYGDLNGLYYDMGYTYNDGSYVIQTPMATRRLFNKWPMEFNINYNSNSTADNFMGNGICNTYSQRVLYHGGNSYTFIDDKGAQLDFWYDEKNAEGVSPLGRFMFVVEEYRYKLKFDTGNEMWFDRASGWMNVHFVNPSLADATSIYHDENGAIEYLVVKDNSRYEFYYDTLPDGSRRVSSIVYMEGYMGENEQVFRFSYDADGNLIDINNDTETEFARGYSYTYENGKLTVAYNKMSGGGLVAAPGPDGVYRTMYVPSL